MRNETNETSVLVSLRELVALEDERVREEEESERARLAAAEEAERRREEAAREAEAARRAAEEQARAERRRREAEEAARLRAIEAAEVERARAEAERQAALEARKSELAHEEKIRAMDIEAKQHRNRRLLGASIVVAVLGTVGAVAGLTAWSTPTVATGPEPSALTPAHRHLLDQRLATLDRVHAQLRDRSSKLDAAPEALRERSEGAAKLRAKMAPGDASDAQLDAFEEALEGMRAELSVAQNQQHLANLDAIHAELKAAVARVSYPSTELKAATKEAEEARSRLGTDPDEPSLRAFSRALQSLTKEAASASPRGGRLPTVPTAPSDGTGPEPCNPKDPMCGDLGI